MGQGFVKALAELATNGESLTETYGTFGPTAPAGAYE
jgi:hypothetical protein